MLYTKEKIEQLRHRWTTARGKRLLRVIKSSRYYLNPVIFRGKVRNLPYINDPELESGVDLRGADLSGFDFRTSVQENDDGFSEKIAILSNVHFEGATLKHCDFQEGKIHNCYFENATLIHSDFKNSSINNSAFSETDCTGIDLHGAKLVNCNFGGAIIKDVTLNSTLVDQKTTFGKKLEAEKTGNYHTTSIEYKQIKEMYKNSSFNGIADFYHYREMVAKRKIAKITNPLRWINFIFGDLLCAYGTSFIRVFLASLFVVFLFAELFVTTDSLLFLNKDVPVSFLDALYFSTVTFTTLGYGDFHAIGLMRFAAGFESFIGIAMISLFTVIVARSIIRD